MHAHASREHADEILEQMNQIAHLKRTLGANVHPAGALVGDHDSLRGLPGDLAYGKYAQRLVLFLSDEDSDPSDGLPSHTNALRTDGSLTGWHARYGQALKLLVRL